MEFEGAKVVAVCQEGRKANRGPGSRFAFIYPSIRQSQNASKGRLYIYTSSLIDSVGTLTTLAGPVLASDE